MQQQRRRDRISELPDEILGQILSSISTKDVVKTCTLLKRWKSVWTFVHAVELKDLALFSFDILSHVEKTGFMNYFDGVLNQVTAFRKLVLSCSCVYDISRIKQWIQLVISKLQNDNVALEELHLKFAAAQQIVKLPPTIFTSKKLVILKLSFYLDLEFPLVVWLPSLKVLLLRPWNRQWKKKSCIDVSCVEKILEGCPNLEELFFEVQGYMRDRLKKERLCVKSSSLKRLTLSLENDVLRIQIDASNLEELVLKFDMPNRNAIFITSLPLLTGLRLNLCNFRPEDKDYCGKTLIELLRKASNIKYLFLSYNAMVCLQYDVFYQQVPICKNLMHLNLEALSSSLPILPCLLKNSPNLVSFALSVIPIPGPLKLIMPQSHNTPSYLTMTMTMLHHLEKVRLSYYQECDHEMELVTYFLKNAPVLKKMIFIFRHQMERKEASLLYNTIVKIPKASIACNFVFRKLKTKAS